MTALAFDPRDLVAPTDADAAVARESARRLVPTLAKVSGSVQLRVAPPNGTDEAVTIPATAFRLLVAILDEMAAGNAVRLIPHHAELATQEAAELLNVSRPFVVKLLDEGQIPSRLVGKHRRVLFKDVVTYRDEHFRARSAVLDRMAAIDQELGLI